MNRFVTIHLSLHCHTREGVYPFVDSCLRRNDLIVNRFYEKRNRYSHL